MLDVEVQLCALAAAASPKAADEAMLKAINWSHSWDGYASHVSSACVYHHPAPKKPRRLEKDLPHPRAHSDNITFAHCAAIDQTGALQKRRGQPRERSVSASQAQRLHRSAYDQPDSQPSYATTSLPLNWITPQHSPQQQHVFDSSIEPFPSWTVPTPPRSDSGLPPLALDANDEPVTCSPQGFSFAPTTASTEMRYFWASKHIVPVMLTTTQFTGVSTSFPIRFWRLRG
nr:hypothetical protein CFP56_38849 [Quercus suber]